MKPINVAVSNDNNTEPSVDFFNNSAEIKQIIGVRKITQSKKALGKKGLGATKVTTNFADIEQRAQLNTPVVESKLTKEEEEEAISSVRLAYKDLSLKKQKEEDRLKSLDPNKAKQMERLGMGFNVRGGISHSIITDMHTINQDQATSNIKSSTKNFDRENMTSSSDDFATSPMYNLPSNKQDFRDAMLMGFEPIDSKQNVYSMFSPTSEKKSPSPSSKKQSDIKTSSKPLTYDSESIQNKFANAKGISSDQFFGNDQSAFEKSSNLSKFQESTAISSAEYFGDGSQNTKSNI